MNKKTPKIEMNNFKITPHEIWVGHIWSARSALRKRRFLFGGIRR